MPRVRFPTKKKKPENSQIYAFIDSQNLNVGVQRMGWKMDWKKFRKYLHDTYGVTEAFMFIGYMPEFEDLYMQMHEAGFKVVLKPTYDMTRPHPEMQPDAEKEKEKQSDGKQKKSEEEEKHIKGNIDADLVLWAMKEIDNYQKAIIVSGDGDFYSLIEHLEANGKLLHIMAPNPHYSNLYNAFKEYVVQLNSKRRELAYHDRRRRKKRSDKNTQSGNKDKKK